MRSSHRTSSPTPRATDTQEPPRGSDSQAGTRAHASSPVNSNEENAEQPATLVAIDDRPARGDLSQPSDAATAAVGNAATRFLTDSAASDLNASASFAEDFFMVHHFNILIAAIDNGLAFPYKHPDSWRTCMPRSLASHSSFLYSLTSRSRSGLLAIGEH